MSYEGKITRFRVCWLLNSDYPTAKEWSNISCFNLKCGISDFFFNKKIYLKKKLAFLWLLVSESQCVRAATASPVNVYNEIIWRSQLCWNVTNLYDATVCIILWICFTNLLFDHFSLSALVMPKLHTDINCLQQLL